MSNEGYQSLDQGSSFENLEFSLENASPRLGFVLGAITTEVVVKSIKAHVLKLGVKIEELEQAFQLEKKAREETVKKLNAKENEVQGNTSIKELLNEEKRNHVETKRKLQELDNLNRQSNQSLRDVESQLKSSNTLAGERQETIHQLQLEQSKLLSDIQAKDSQFRRLDTEHSKLKSEFEDTSDRLDKAKKSFETTKTSLSATQEQLRRLELERDRLASEKTHLESENDRLQKEYQTTSDRLDKAKNLLDATNANLKKEEEVRVKAEAEALQQRGRADVISEENHVPGIFSQRDPAVPGDFFGLYQQLMGQIKTYSGLVMRKFTAATKSAVAAGTQSPEPIFVQRFMQHIVSGHQFVNEAMPLPDNYFRKAMLVGSFVRELLVGFGSEALEMGSVSLPIDVTKLRPLRAGYRGQHDLIMKTRTTDLKGSDSAFVVWFTGVLSRLKAIWLGASDDETVWVQFFEDSTSEMAAQLWEIGRYTWALNKLSLAYPIPPHMLRLDNGIAATKDLCKSWFNEDAEVEQNFREGLMVFCVVFPGFQVDTNIQECDVVWFDAQAADQTLVTTEEEAERVRVLIGTRVADPKAAK